MHLAAAAVVNGVAAGVASLTADEASAEVEQDSTTPHGHARLLSLGVSALKLPLGGLGLSDHGLLASLGLLQFDSLHVGHVC